MKILHCCLANFYIDNYGYQENILNFVNYAHLFCHFTTLYFSVLSILDRLEKKFGFKSCKLACYALITN